MSGKFKFALSNFLGKVDAGLWSAGLHSVFDENSETIYIYININI